MNALQIIVVCNPLLISKHETPFTARNILDKLKPCTLSDNPPLFFIPNYRPIFGMLQAVSFQDELLPFLNAVLVAEDKK